MRGLSCRAIATGLVGLGLALPVGAQDSRATQRRSTQSQSSQDQASRDQATEQARAAQWHLSTTQWRRYQTLLQGIDGYRSSTLDPITLLGMYAHTDAERRRYATKLARLEHDRVERVLAFQKAYDAAFKRLYPSEQPMRTDALARALASGRESAQRLGLAGSQRKAVYVDARHCPACAATVERLAAAHTPMDIFVVDAAGDDDSIRAWAQRVGLDPARVRSGQITLNHAPAAVAEQLQGQSLPRVVDR